MTEARENLFTKKPEKVFFQEARDQAQAENKVAVLLKGFDNSEKNMILDDRAMKTKNANKEHTIIVRSMISESLCSQIQQRNLESSLKSAHMFRCRSAQALREFDVDHPRLVSMPHISTVAVL
jgi:hypothetical protein